MNTFLEVNKSFFKHIVMSFLGKKSLSLAAHAQLQNARTHAQVLAQASEPALLRGVSMGGWNSPSAAELRIKCA